MALFLRKDFDAARLRLVARESDDADPVRRLLTLAAIYDGMSRAGAAQIGGVTRQIVRDWVVRWRLVDLVQWVWERSAISISRQTLGRGLRAMGYRKLSARPRHHAQAAGAAEAFGKASRPRRQQSRARRASISGEPLGSTPAM